MIMEAVLNRIMEMANQRFLSVNRMRHHTR